MKKFALWFVVVLALSLTLHAAAPVVSNVRASQRPGSKLVDIYYDLADADGGLQLVEVAVSADGGLTYTIPCVTLSGHVGAGVSIGTNRAIVWNAGADWNGNFVSSTKARVTAHDGTTPPAPPGMVYIAGGPFQMGDNFSEVGPDALPVHNVEVAAFFMDKYEVYKELWEQVKAWGNANGYAIGGGAHKDNSHPAHSVNWYDAIKWCNARSEMEGRTPCYYTDEARTAVYRSGNWDLTGDKVNWNANGYRLPTEAEWEKAARGGMTGKRYPWGDTVTGANANYYYTGNPYHTGNQPWTSPKGSYPGNGYGLHDMAGNIFEWCWDWYSPTYYGAPESLNDPRGPTTGSYRLLRGGSWGDGNTSNLPCARRSFELSAGHVSFIGFRSVRGL